ncbi:MAG TPA: methyltransferase domain-containing protein [Dongiaceae bacterium]|nr:methyltransferase domain-containing protein [Dongiaceae bacterium]
MSLPRPEPAAVRLDREWYRTFFDGLTLDFWDVAVPPEQTRLEVDFLERALGIAPGMPVLDVACGLGRHAIPLAQRGARLTGADQSRPALDRAAAAARAAGVKITWVEADLRSLPWTAAFDAGYCCGNSLGYIEPEETRAGLAAIGRALRPGARFTLDTGMAAESILPRFREREESETAGFTFIEENRYHPREGCIETTYTIRRGGESLTRTGLQYLFTLRDIVDAVEAAGFAVEALEGGIDGGPFALGSPLLVVRAMRRRATGGAAR